MKGGGNEHTPIGERMGLTKNQNTQQPQHQDRLKTRTPEQTQTQDLVRMDNTSHTNALTG